MAELRDSLRVSDAGLFSQALGEIGSYRIELASDVVIASATAANPIVVTTSGNHGYGTGDLVLIHSMSQMTHVNRQVYRILNASGTTFTIEKNGVGLPAETVFGLAQKLVPSTGTLEAYERYASVRREVLEEHPWNCATAYARLSRLASGTAIVGITQNNPAGVGSFSHGLATGDLVYISGVVGMTEINGRYFTVSVSGPDNFSLDGEDSTSYAAYSSGGTAQKALTPLKPDFGFTYRYSQPLDFLRMLNIVDAGFEDEPWEHVGQEIFADLGPTVQIRYTRLILDPALYSSQLYAYMSARLAHRMAWRLTQSSSIVESLRNEADELGRLAKMTDGQEQSASALAPSSWITARF